MKTEKYKVKQKKRRLKDLTTKLRKECNEVMEGLLGELVDLESKLSLEGDPFVVETIIKEKIKRFDVKECLLVLAGIFELESLDFVLKVIERECLRKVIHSLGKHPLRLYRTVMDIDRIFEEACKEAIKERNPEKLCSLGITLNSHFENLRVLYRSVKDSKVFRDVFESKVDLLYNDLLEIPKEPTIRDVTAFYCDPTGKISREKSKKIVIKPITKDVLEVYYNVPKPKPIIKIMKEPVTTYCKNKEKIALHCFARVTCRTRAIGKQPSLK